MHGELPGHPTQRNPSGEKIPRRHRIHPVLRRATVMPALGLRGGSRPPPAHGSGPARTPRSRSERGTSGGQRVSSCQSPGPPAMVAPVAAQFTNEEPLGSAAGLSSTGRDTDIVGPGEIRVRDRLGEEGYPTWSAIDSRTTAVHRPRQATHSRRPSIARPRSVVVLDEVREGECPRRAFSPGRASSVSSPVRTTRAVPQRVRELRKIPTVSRFRFPGMAMVFGARLLPRYSASHFSDGESRKTNARALRCTVGGSRKGTIWGSPSGTSSSRSQRSNRPR